MNMWTGFANPVQRRSKTTNVLLSMMNPKINFFKFLANELSCFCFKWQSLILILALYSFFEFFSQDQDLSELKKAVYGGVISSFIFYLLVDSLPKISDKKERILYFAKETEYCLNFASEIFLGIKANFDVNKNSSIESSKRFEALVLGKTHDIKSSSKAKFIEKEIDGKLYPYISPYNLGQCLEEEYDKLKIKAGHLSMVASATQMDIFFKIEIGKIINLEPIRLRLEVMKYCKQAEPFGANLDKVYDSLLGIKKELSTKYGIFWKE